MLSLLITLAFAQDPAVNTIAYDGGNSGSAPNYKKGKPITVSHSGGNVAVRCMETEQLTARVQYQVEGTAEGPMETFGKGIGLSVFGDANGGGARTRVPSKPSAVIGYSVDLTVNVPKGVSAITVSQTGPGWVQVLDCSGTVKVTGGGGGAYVSGAFTGGSVTASGGDVKFVTDPGTVLKAATTVSAPGGNLVVTLPSAQGGKLTAKGGEVSVQQTVMGQNTPTLVAGDMGVAGPAMTFSAKGRVEVGQH